MRKEKILIVDDEEMITDSIATYLELTTELIVFTTNNPLEGIEIVKENQIDLVISDFLMPEINGINFFKKIREINNEIVLILLTGYADKENAIKAINEVGLYYYIEKPWNNEELVKIVHNGLEKRELQIELKNKISELESSEQEIKRLYQLLKQEYDQEKENIEDVIISLAKAIEAKDEYTEGHAERVKGLAMRLGEELGLGKDKIKILETAAVIHDIGKIGIPEEVLNKPGRLSDEEYQIIKRHPKIGEDICKPLHTLEKTRQLVRMHHEKLDGSGYPDGLKADQLTLEARILTVVDIFDALYSDRPYRNKLPLEECFRILKEDAQCGKLDMKVVDALIRLIEEREIEV